MSKKEKLIKKLKSKPRDFTFDEAETLATYLGYNRANMGRTSGSKVRFRRKNGSDILLHKPHPHKELKPYQINQLIEDLEKENLI